ncbi:MAG: TonB-dependent receptor [Hyphomicrobium sp.]|uniref:TonB-dependent receptor plug domain-containing protein n=1 Tax=Hyphomicrobium sp. TaxID=82 RepID=UPI003564CBDD
MSLNASGKTASHGLKSVLFSASAIVGFAGFAVSASAQVTELEGVTIYSANQTPMDAAKVGSSVEVLTEKDLQKQSKTYLKDYLAQLPGVNFYQSGPPGAQSGIFIRGAASKYVKVLVDGMDVSDPSATQTATSFEHLLVGDISRIEVLKGSQSTLYGGDAVGGVITIQTKAALTPGFSQQGNIEGGQYGTINGAYTAGYLAANGSNIALTIQGAGTDGFSAYAYGREDDGYQNLTFSGRGEYFLTPSWKVFFAARALDAKYNYDGYANSPPYAFGDTLDNGTTTQQVGRVGTEFSLLNGAFQNTLAIQGMNVRRETFNDKTRGGWYDGDRIKGEYKGILTFNEKLSLLIGADWERTGTTTSGLSDRVTADFNGYYAQLMMEPIQGLFLTGGGRIDDHSTFGTFDTYRITGAYLVPGTETKFHSSVGTGFRAPSLYELYAPTYGNRDLTPEESFGWDAGVEQGFDKGRYRIGATYFELDTDNLIDYHRVTYQYFNVPGTVHRNGVEVSGAATLTNWLTLTGGYTYTDATDADGKRLLRVPRHSFSAGINVVPIDKVAVNVTAQYVADVVDDSFDVRGIVALNDYVLIGAKASYEFAPGWKAYVRGENLLNENYQTVLDYGTPGASVYGGLTMALPSD